MSFPIKLQERLFKKISYLLGLLTIGILAGIIIFSASGEIQAFDIWLHLKAGEVMVQSQSFLTTDIFSCTVSGQPWINHGWLFQIIAHLVFTYAGSFEGLAMMQGAVVGVTILLLLLLGDVRGKQIETIGLLFLVMMVYQTRFNIRPDIFSLLYFALFVYTLTMLIEKRWSAFVLCVIQILWVNTHGFFIFGPMLIAVGICSEVLKRRVRLPWQWNETARLTDQELGNLKIALGLTLLASLINPQVFRGAFYPLGILFQMSGESRIFFDHIMELKRPLTMSTFFSPVYSHYKILIFVSFYSFVLNRKKIDISALLLWVFFLAFSMTAVRNMIFFAFVAYFVSFANFSETPIETVLPVSFKNKRFKEITLIGAKFLILFYLLQFGSSLANEGYFDFDKYQIKSSFEGVSLGRYPAKAADFIIENKVTGNFFNDFNSGAYLIGRCFPQVKVFVDGRTELYGPEFFKEYQKILSGEDPEILEQALLKYQVTGALLSSVHTKIPKGLLTYFYNNEQWVLVYLDDDGAIFLKDVSAHQHVIAAHRLSEENLEFPSVDLMRLGVRRVTPDRQVKRAYTLEQLGLRAHAIAQAQQALLISPGNPDPYYILGRYYEQDEDYQKAFEHFRIASMTAPQDPDFRYHLASSLAKLENRTDAIRYLRDLIKRDRPAAKSFSLLARLLILECKSDEALDITRQALNLDARYTTKALETADFLMEQKEFALAKQVCVLALEKDSDLSDAYYCIGKCFQELGQEQESRQAFQRGLTIDPEHEDIKKALGIK